MIEICKYTECTGCYACANVCGHDAITMHPNEYGFIHPKISAERCTDCGACRIVCPNNRTPLYRKPIKAFVGCASDACEQLTSTSGGIASVLSRYTLKEGGIVYGCTGKDWKNVHHIKIERESDVDLLKGSKYVQSKIGAIFKDIKKKLITGRKVLFVGTPCQVAGLLSFIPKKLQEQLLTVDFVCHGVPNQRMLSEWISKVLGKEIKGNVDLEFRIKECKRTILSKTIIRNNDISDALLRKKYRTRYGLFLFDEDSLILNHPFPNDDYMLGFLTGLIYRDSCYQCHYARPERVSDITLGDFHFGRNQRNKIPGENRLLSKIIVNTEKGQAMIADLQLEIGCLEIDYQVLLNGKSQLTHSMPCHPKRKEFLHEYNIDGIAVLSKYLKQDKIRLKHHILVSSIVEFLYSLPIVNSLLNKMKHA